MQWKLIHTHLIGGPLLLDCLTYYSEHSQEVSDDDEQLGVAKDLCRGIKRKLKIVEDDNSSKFSHLQDIAKCQLVSSK